MDMTILREKVSDYCNDSDRGALNRLAKEIGVTRQNLYSWRSKKTNMGSEKIVKLIRFLKIQGVIAPTEFSDLPSGIIPMIDLEIPDENKCYELLKFIRKQVKDIDQQTAIIHNLLGILKDTDEIKEIAYELKNKCDALQIELQNAAED